MNLRFVLALILLTIGLGNAEVCQAEGVARSVKAITGIYSNLKYVKEAGDLVGVELFLLNTNDGLYVVFQSAEGGAASVPVVVKASLAGNRIEFNLPDITAYPGKFTGTIDNARIVGEFDKGYPSPTQPGSKFVMLRKNSYWQR